MNILLDMNLSPKWVEVLTKNGFRAIHWTTVGPINAADSELLSWAKKHDHIIFTHDLDFGALLAASNGNSPSVIQLRMQDISPQASASLVLQILHDQAETLQSGALISVDANQNRVRILPMRET